MEKDPRIVIEHAVRGMLQHNTLGAEQFNKLKVYVGSEHPHAAQKPVVLPKEGGKCSSQPSSDLENGKKGDK